MPLFAAAIFLSAFLLFQVQPVIARYILPWYGGSPAVWTTCLLFFQIGLLGGYAYAHVLVSLLRKRRRWQVGVHFALLGVALALLPITPDETMKPLSGDSRPIQGIVALLGLTVGFPYLLLSASGPLLQHWFSDAYPGRSPYRLYAISNAGSMLGLLTYPFFFEPLLSVTRQTQIWSWSFAIYAAAAVACGLVLLKNRRPLPAMPEIEEERATPPSRIDQVLWIGFAACGSMLLLSLTNQMCQDVSVVPFLWVLPLSLYLLTFVISFDHERWYRRWIAIPLAILGVGAVVYLINEQFADDEMHIAGQIGIFLAAIFTGCLVCHGEIVRIKPASRHLTGFYLAISFGGALGGLFVSVIAPMIFDGYWELHVSLLLLAFLTSAALVRNAGMVRRLSLRMAGAIGLLAVLVLLSYGLRSHIKVTNQGILASSRSFYGTLRIYEENVGTENHYRALYHGRISHGRQYLEEDFRGLPTTYYNERSGVGAAFARLVARHEEVRPPIHLGIVGLGVGTLSTYAEAGDRVHYYEIDPDVEDMARRHFTYLEDCEGDVSVVLGDARISMEEEWREDGSQTFDILVIDAFSGDSIPVHLLTQEAFALYFQHLKPDGILAVHISNLHLDLSDPVRVLSESFDYPAYRVDHNPADEDLIGYYSDWILVTRDSGMQEFLEGGSYLTEWEREEPKPVLWTDDYSNLLDVVMWNH